jgi:hypothetical protein
MFTGRLGFPALKIRVEYRDYRQGLFNDTREQAAEVLEGRATKT